jgi:oligopeptide/dipeptide ABC transporter ATP-binding protein
MLAAYTPSVMSDLRDRSDFLVIASHLVKTFLSGGFLARRARKLTAVDDVNFRIRRGESLGLVGESGCGKTTVARMLLRMIEPSDGRVVFDGIELLDASPERLRKLRTRMQIIFQDPYAALNPRKTVLQTLEKPYRIHRKLSGRELRDNVWRLVEDVGLVPAEHFIYRYPHELSGGQRQRVVIARAIALKPEFVVADEPVSALDVSVRAQILNLLRRLQADHSLTYLFISHELSIVRSMCDRVAVMYLGKIVENGPTEGIFTSPMHPYTRALLASTPVPDPTEMKGREAITLDGEVPSPLDRPPGCYFHPRCPLKGLGCDTEYPATREFRRGHLVACHFAQESPC